MVKVVSGYGEGARIPGDFHRFGVLEFFIYVCMYVYVYVYIYIYICIYIYMYIYIFSISENKISKIRSLLMSTKRFVSSLEERWIP